MAKKSTQSPESPKKPRSYNVENKYNFTDNPEENAQKILTVPAVLAQGNNLKGQKKIAYMWEQVLEASRLGYEQLAICKALGLHRKLFYDFLKNNPDKRRELTKAQNEPRDQCVKAVLDAAKKGTWVAAAWWLERTRGMEFAKPEVKLQYWDRMVANDSIEQRIAGKTLEEISEDLKQQYKDHENVGKYFKPNESEQGRLETGETGSDVDHQPDAGQEGPDSGS